MSTRDLLENTTRKRDLENSWLQTQMKRETWLVDKCNSGMGTKKFSTDHIYVDDKHKVLYCYIPKAWCTVWKNLLSAVQQNCRLASNQMNIHFTKTLHNQGIHTLRTKTSAERDVIIKTYKKFLFVRDPLERLVSAYRNEFEYNADPYLKSHV